MVCFTALSFHVCVVINSLILCMVMPRQSGKWCLLWSLLCVWLPAHSFILGEAFPDVSVILNV